MLKSHANGKIWFSLVKLGKKDMRGKWHDFGQKRGKIWLIMDSQEGLNQAR